MMNDNHSDGLRYTLMAATLAPMATAAATIAKHMQTATILSFLLLMKPEFDDETILQSVQY
jgi:hypothetical protein